MAKKVYTILISTPLSSAVDHAYLIDQIFILTNLGLQLHIQLHNSGTYSLTSFLRVQSHILTNSNLDKDIPKSLF